MNALVQVRSLSVDFRVGRALVRVVDDIDLEIAEGETYGLVGPSGAGKSTVALALTRYLTPGMQVRARQLEVAGRDLLTLSRDDLRAYRRRDIGVVYQEPGLALNPTARVGAHIAETYRLSGIPARQAWRAAVDSLAEVGLNDAEASARAYPHELSGGEQQRVMIAIALAGRPRLLVLDEPTTGLDALVRNDILALMCRLQEERGFASILISHDREMIAARCDRVGILEQGRMVDTPSSSRVVDTPSSSRVVDRGHTRERPLVAVAAPVMGTKAAARTDESAILVASGVRKRFGPLIALDGVDLHLGRGETLGVVGESGSGKTTLGRVLASLTSHEGTVIVRAPGSPPPVQVVFQNPDASLNPRRTVRQALRRAIELLHGDSTPERLAELMGLPLDTLDRLPSRLSGGQKQRVAIARAFAGSAPIVVCDEPTSSLDADTRARIFDLLTELQERTGTSYVLISHDLAVVRGLAHRVAVMRHGRILETAPTSTIFSDAAHPYTRDLVDAAEDGTRRRKDRPTIDRTPGEDGVML